MNTRSKGRVVLFSVMIFALAFAGCQIFPSYAPISVKVTVQDAAGNLVDGAKVTLNGPEFDGTAHSANGLAVIQNVVPGNYVLMVSYPNGAAIDRSFPVWGGEDFEIVVKLKPADQHLIAAWQFEENDGPIVADSSPRRHGGSIVGNVTRVPGYSGQGLRFDGGHIVVPNHQDFNLDMERTFTVSVWANFDDPGADQKLVGRTTTSNGFVLGAQKESLRPELWAPGHHDFEEGDIKTGEWTHLLITFEAGVGMTGYVNGEEVSHVNIANPMGRNNNDLIIGVAPWNRSSYPFKGIMDEVYIYDRVLSIDEIKALAQ